MIPNVIDTGIYTGLKDQMGADFIVELIDTYLEETSQLITQLNQALASGETVPFERYAHSIKSSSASLGAINFSHLARQLELMGKAGDLSGAAPIVEQLVVDFQHVRSGLEELRNES